MLKDVFFSTTVRVTLLPITGVRMRFNTAQQLHFGTLLKKGFPVSKSGSTPRGSCNDNSICGNVDEASLLGVPEFVFNCEPDGSEGVATRPLSEMMVRQGL